MRIHEFLERYGDEVCAACIRNFKPVAPEISDEELARHFRLFIGRVVQRLRHACGLTDGASSERALRETAASVGHEVHERGLSIESAARSFATLSVSLGEVGGRYRLAFDAEEYRSFNEAIDDSVAAAIEQFARDARAEHEHATSERVGFLAHELRNAIASAQMAFAVLEQGQVGTAGRTAAILRRSLHRMGALVEQTLVDVHLSEAAPPALRAVLVTPVLREIESDCVLERGISIAVDAEDALSAITDEHLLTVAVGNLLQNAIKCSRDRAVIALRARAELDAVVVEVEDECGGLPAGSAEEMFEPFVQQREHHRGFGLGLAITRRAADAMAARITVRDLPGKGCVFALRLRPAGAIAVSAPDAATAH